MTAVMEEQMVLPVPGGSGLGLKVDILDLAQFRGVDGITVAEVREFFGVHHGRASGALSSLHAAGSLERLSERRERCHVYVEPTAVGGRLTQAPGRAVRHVQEVTDPAVLVDRLEEAVVEGRLESLADVQQFAANLREAIFAVTGKQVKVHNAGCYRSHPECALNAVVRYTTAQQRGLEA